MTLAARRVSMITSARTASFARRTDSPSRFPRVFERHDGVFLLLESRRSQTQVRPLGNLLVSGVDSRGGRVRREAVHRRQELLGDAPRALRRRRKGDKALTADALSAHADRVVNSALWFIGAAALAIFSKSASFRLKSSARPRRHWEFVSQATRTSRELRRRWARAEPVDLALGKQCLLTSAVLAT